jgi:hypothetical protein
MRSDEQQLDDPLLREALRRAIGGEQAPPMLRSRVKALLDRNGHASHAPARAPRVIPTRSGIAAWWMRWQSPIYGSIAAAAVILGIGILVLAYNGALDTRHDYTVPQAVLGRMPSTFGSALVTAHNRCAGMSNHRMAAQDAGNDLAAVQAALEKKLAIPVMTTNPGEGWIYRGAGACEVAGRPAAHVLFSSGTVHISVFSMHASALDGAAEGTYYAGTFDGLPMAGFVYAEALHCIIGSSDDGAGGAPSLDELMTIRDRMAATCGASSYLPSPCGGDLTLAAPAASMQTKPCLC